MSKGNLFISVMDSSVGSLRTVLLSTDTGNTWSRADSGLIGFSRIVCFFSDTGGNIYGLAGEGVITYDILYRWDIANNLWSPVFNFSPAFLINRIKVTSQNIFFAATSDGMIVSFDSGATWLPKGLYPNTCTALQILPADTLVVGTNRNGVFISVDAGLNWTQNAVGLPDDPISPVVKDPISALCFTDDRLFAGTKDSGVYRTVQHYDAIETANPNNQIKIGPNPAADKLNISESSNRSVTLAIKICNYNGEAIYQRIILPSESEDITVPLQNVDGGFYFCSVITSAGTIIRKITVIK